MFDSVKDGIKGTCKPILDNEKNEQSMKDGIKNICKPILDNEKNEPFVVTIPDVFYNEEPISKSFINSDKNRQCFYEELGEALDILDECESQSDLSSVTSTDIREVENMFEHFAVKKTQSEEVLEIF